MVDMESGTHSSGPARRCLPMLPSSPVAQLKHDAVSAFDDTSPLIEYAPADAWDHVSGSAAQAYANDTFSRTSVEGATAKFSFSGTGFWLYGATQEDYGEYLLIVDGEVIKYANATSNDPQTMQVLGKSTGLQDGKHEVVLMSGGRGDVDIDAIMYETKDQTQIDATLNGVLKTVQSGATSTVQSTSTTSTAKATGRLKANPNAVGGPGDDGSGPVSSSPSATGDSASPAATGRQPPAAIGGRPAAVGGQPVATTDAQPTASAAASLVQSETAPQSASTIASSVAPSSSGQTERANGASLSQANRGLSVGAIIGISVGAVIGLLLLLGLVFLFLRRRRAKARRQTMAPLMSPVLPLQDPDVENGPYFFGGRVGGAGTNPMREMYLAQGPASRAPIMSQPRGAGASLGGRASPYAGDSPPPAAPGTRESSYSAYTEYSQHSSSSSGSSKMPPTRPARPLDLRLSGI
ncbi:hypothetical protein C8Q80DRAFT_1345997 [Daedaleopsis nitida]|nr:hypothetical protein C8Q80DRAFT_1345997 [Daedaleopsis nitida]